MIFNTTLLRFISVGLGNTALGLTVIYVCMGILRLSDVQSNAIGYAIGVVFSFVFNKKWTFRHRGGTVDALVRFLLVFALAYAANLAAVLIAINTLAWNRYLAQAVGVVVYAAIGYLGSLYFAFPVKAQDVH